jgi:hypothetical protein
MKPRTYIEYVLDETYKFNLKEYVDSTVYKGQHHPQTINNSKTDEAIHK